MSHIEQMTGRVEPIARAWAAAAAAAYAYAPRHIVEALLGEASGDLVRAVMLGTAAAAQQAVDRGDLGPIPRGCSVEFCAGRAQTIVWETETHRVSLSPRIADAYGSYMSAEALWVLVIEAPSEDSYRIQAARNALDEAGEDLVAADEDGYDRIVRGATDED